jgi:hypothetical protein
VPYSFKNHKGVVSAAIRHSSKAFFHASPELKNDPAFILEAMRNKRYIFQYVSSDLRDNSEFMLQAIRLEPAVFRFASPALTNTNAFVCAAVTVNGSVFSYIPRNYQMDPEIILIALATYNHTLYNASLALRGDRRFMLEAIKRNAYAFNHAAVELQQNKHFWLDACRMNHQVLAHLPVYAITEDMIQMAIEQSRRDQRGVFTIDFHSERLLDRVLALIQKGPIKKIHIQALPFLYDKSEWKLFEQYLPNSNVVEISTWLGSTWRTYPPPHIQKILTINTEKNCVIAIGQGLFFKSRAHRTIECSTVPYAIMFKVMEYLLNSINGSGYSTVHEACVKNQCLSYGDIDKVFPALMLVQAVMTLSSKKCEQKEKSGDENLASAASCKF